MSDRTILIVDDSPSMRQIMARALSNAGYQTVQATDGQDALDQLRDGARVDLALVDFNMPRLDGVSLVRELRAWNATRFVPIVMITTETRRERREQARAAGATGWIVKPFHPDDVLTMLKRLLPR
jgi:two-component system chemotaxis response regulator CheY